MGVEIAIHLCLRNLHNKSIFNGFLFHSPHIRRPMRTHIHAHTYMLISALVNAFRIYHILQTHKHTHIRAYVYMHLSSFTKTNVFVRKLC